ncbi:MAG: CHASE domain-containing protein [Proteobacteria bacterium]|nr:CHASE domain-containing protein [Pseudomonadota bacterium]
MNTKNNPALIIILVVVVGVCVSGFSGWSLYKADEKAIINDFKKDVDARAASLYREVAINLETLHSLSVMFSGDSIPTFRQFSSEAKKILSRHNDIQALEWIPRVLHSERVLYETMNRQDFPDFQITERESQGHMVTAKERAEYYPVYYLEPIIGNEAAFGFDLASNPTRYETLKNSRDYNRPLATASIKLVQENESQKGFLAFLPLYKDKLSTERISRSNFRGFVLGVFRIGDIFNNSALSEEPLGIDMVLVDETHGSKHDTLHVHKSRTGLAVDEFFSYKKELPDFLGRKWSIIAKPTLSYTSDRRSWLPGVVFFAGIILTLILSFYILQIVKRTSIIQQTVVKRTKELNDSNKKLVDTQDDLKNEQERTEKLLQKRTEELEEAQLQLIQAEKMETIGMLAAGIAHEVKNPLAIIQLGVDYIVKSKKDEDITEVTKDIEEAIVRADTVIKELLDFSASKQLNMKIVDLNPVIEESLLLVKHELMKKNIDVVVQYDENLPQVEIDQNKIEQVCINLLVNAINAMGKKGTLTIKTYSERVEKVADYFNLSRTGQLLLGDIGVVLDIEDDGSGILEDKLDKIFDPFFTTKQSGASIGLGLTVTQNIIRLHNAILNIKNKEDGGVRASVVFRAEGGH